MERRHTHRTSTFKKARCPKCGTQFVLAPLTPAVPTPPPIPAPPPIVAELVGQPELAQPEVPPPVIHVEAKPKAAQKGFWATVKEAAQSKMRCSSCGAGLGVWENATGIGLCAKCALPNASILANPSELVTFSQVANYREGIANRNSQSKKNGYIYVCQNHLCFVDLDVRWAVSWENVHQAEIDVFKPGSVQSMLAGLNSVVLRQIKSALAITYCDEAGVTRTARFNIHGAVTVYGDQDKATELLGHISVFRSRFAGARSVAVPQSDIATLLEKLGALRQQGLLSDDEFQRKKAELLARL